MPIVNQEHWNNDVEINKDSYSKACVDTARRAMEILDSEYDGKDITNDDPHTIICRASHEVDCGGITGFMAGCVAQMIWVVHSRGEDFRKAFNGGYGVTEEKAKGGIINPAIITIGRK